MDVFEIRNGVLTDYYGRGGRVIIPKSVTEIGFGAFGDCEGLTAVTIPESVTTIRSGAFKGCTGLKTVTLPDSVTEGGDNVFSECTGLTSVTIPDSVTGLHQWAFSDCSPPTSLRIRRIILDEDRIADLEQKCNAASEYFLYALVTYDLVDASDIALVWAAFACCPEDERNTDYLREHFEEAFRFLIEENDAETTLHVLRCGLFDDLLRDRIDGFIEYAIGHELLEIQLLLTNYKAEKRGYTDIKKRLEL